MDAHAHLLSLGWAGPGHALDSKPYKQKGHRGLAYDPTKANNTGNGLVKPLLISQRKGRLGIGKKAHEPQAGNEWWLKGFESALGNIGKSESERSSGTSTPVLTTTGGKHSGLYSFFIKGQEMAGTIGDINEIKPIKKRKSDVLDSEESDDKGSLATGSVIPSKKSKIKPAVEFEQVSEYIALRDKDEKRRQCQKKMSPVEEFQLVSQYIQARSEKKKRRRESDKQPEETDATVDREVSDVTETKEERRERRKRRREEKERLRSKSIAQKLDTSARLSEDDVEDPAVKAARRAERKKRKAEKAAASSKAG